MFERIDKKWKGFEKIKFYKTNKRRINQNYLLSIIFDIG